MPRIPVLGRLYSREYFAVIVGFILLGFETLLRGAIFFLPDPVICWFRDRTKTIFTTLVGIGGSRSPDVNDDEAERANAIRMAVDFAELCGIYGYEWEEHIVQTKDGYLLTLHRIPRAKNERHDPCEQRPLKPVVYIHHGLMMSSDVFLCTTDAQRSVALRLADAGYDVWLGNNRGNKYSRKHISMAPHEAKFWNFGIDEYALYDIPDSIAYILDTTGEASVSYVGFSQGTAQAFAALSIHPKLNQKINVFVAMAPAMSPPGLAAPLVDGLMKSSPALMYLFFGRRAILPSTTMWQSILYPPIFTAVIHKSLKFMFNWRSLNISPTQKIAAFAHLYSHASTKAVVHWFQIMRNAEFTMYDDDTASGLSPVSAHEQGKARFYYRPARYPTRNIVAPTVLLYGTDDSLVDIAIMLRQLPAHTKVVPLEGYEHVDILWGDEVHKDVIPEVLAALKQNARLPNVPVPSSSGAEAATIPHAPSLTNASDLDTQSTSDGSGC